MRFGWLFIALYLFGCSQNTQSAKKKPIVLNTFRKLSEAEKEAYLHKALPIYQQGLARNFSGAILVAKNGEIIFEDYQGLLNQQTADSIGPNTPIHLASISKTFTSMAILQLVQAGKLSINDSIQHFFPAFPYQGIQIEHLLNHRSGLPNYVYYMEAEWRKKKTLATNQDVLSFLYNQKPPIQAYPNRCFNYCNTNYVLLALVIEKITKSSYPQYLKDSIFTPLGMNNSYVFSIADTAQYIPSYNFNNAIFSLDVLDCIYGDKNVYSTPRDLLIWDAALYSNQFFNKETLERAFTGYSNERPSVHNYGFGWRLLFNKKQKTIYHNGWWHGNNTVFTRLIEDTATVIVLGNKYNRGIYWGARSIGMAIAKNADSTRLEE
jgi:CubicO group peptidase (beta-lactamase class C family)